MTTAGQDRALAPDKEAELLAALETIYPPGFAQTPGASEVFEVEIHARAYWFRQRYIPWIEATGSLMGSRVLEVGAGTGTSAIPFAERGAVVHSIDINPAGLEVARVRAELHGLSARTDFRFGNAKDIGEQFAGTSYDLIAYFAAIEHMTHPERIKTLRAAWALLRPSGRLVVVDTPNRLWYYDEHTSFSNFFHWLPNEVAIDYACNTKRDGFNTEFNAPDPTADVRMSRWGRGCSFHEFEIALGPVGGIETSGEWEFRRQTQPDWAAWWKPTRDGRYHDFLKEAAPDMPVAWFEPEIALSLTKPA